MNNTSGTETLPATEPAIPSYFFGKGYADLGNTILESWRLNTESASERFADSAGAEWFLTAFHIAAGIAILVFGTAFFLVASALHITLLLTFFLIIYLGFSLVFLSDWTYRTVRSFFTVCPDCHHKAPLPEFACPRCRRWHGQLAPNKYGILHHTCLCGEKLPCVFFLRRSRLESRCPVCETTLDTVHTHSRKAFIPVLGGVAVGKTVFLAVALNAYRQFLNVTGGKAAFQDQTDETEFQDVIRRLSHHGRLPDKTIFSLPRAKVLRLMQQPQDQENRLLYLYDPAGEALQDSDLLATHRYLEYLSGILLLVDPFVFHEFKVRFGNPEGDNSDRALPTEVFDRILNNMYEHFGLSIKKKIQVPVAVVLTKMDMLPTGSQLRPPTNLLSANVPSYAETLAIYSGSVRSLLQDVGLTWVIQKLENKCANIAYFSCSALGKTPRQGLGVFQGWGCFEPVAWILSRRNKDYLPMEKAKT